MVWNTTQSSLYNAPQRRSYPNGAGNRPAPRSAAVNEQGAQHNVNPNRQVAPRNFSPNEQPAPSNVNPHEQPAPNNPHPNVQPAPELPPKEQSEPCAAPPRREEPPREGDSPQRRNAAPRGFLSALTGDSDALLLCALIFLLLHEKADMKLVLALAFVLLC